MPNTFLKNHVNFRFALDYILRILIVPVSSGNFGSVQETVKYFVICVFVIMTKY